MTALPLHRQLGQAARHRIGTDSQLPDRDREPHRGKAGQQLGEDRLQFDAGELVLLDNRAANHDPAVFPSPDCFDITRQGLAHLSFGHGAHYCLGAPLARIELLAVFSQLLARFPTMRLAVPVEQLRVRSDAVTGGLTGLPVEW